MTQRSAFALQPDTSYAVVQGPDDVLDYALDHAELLTGGDTIATSDWTTTGDVAVSEPQHEGSLVRATISGTNGTVSNTVTTAFGRRKKITFSVLPNRASASLRCP